MSADGDYRVGHGFDAHPLVSDRRLVLGGVVIPYSRGLAGHSDADVLLHAVIDAFLGAVAGGDIGQWFPDQNEKYRDADSRRLLSLIIEADQYRVWKLSNLDCTVMAEKPRLAEYIPSIRRSIADLFSVSIDRISVKATTMEGMGFIGRREGVAANAVILLRHVQS